ncbi:MAG: hypothetical protein ACE5HU_00255 [Acidobacteriota bacterium]
MKLRGHLLCWLHRLSIGLILGAVVMGYAADYSETAIGTHVWAGFLFAVIMGFTFAMTVFYFAGLGVGMRQAAAGRADLAKYLERAAALRKRLALPLGLALVTLMAAVILGGGSQTRTLPDWPHHLFSLGALVSTIYASWKSERSIRANESLVSRLEAVLEGIERPAGRAAPGT